MAEKLHDPTEAQATLPGSEPESTDTQVAPATTARRAGRPAAAKAAGIPSKAADKRAAKAVGKAVSSAAKSATATSVEAVDKPSKAPRKVASSKESVPASSAAPQAVIGIDIGGSGIKGAPVNIATGEFLADRLRIETPVPSTPEACCAVVKQIVDSFADKVAPDTPVGITYPGVVWNGVTLTAANVDKGWIKHDSDAMFQAALGRPVTVLNDAQAAVLAECTFGAAKGHQGLVLMLTFGTGIGSGLAYRGVAIPGVEFGHLVMHGKDAEALAAASVKEKQKLSWKKWSERVNEYLFRIEKMCWPELILIGGGLSDEPEKFLSRLKSRAPIMTAKLVNDAGIVGAAIAATTQANIH